MLVNCYYSVLPLFPITGCLPESAFSPFDMALGSLKECQILLIYTTIFNQGN